MTIESITRILIYIHAAFGGVALLSGTVAMIAPKGKNIHKKAGKVFYYTMLVTGISALIVSMIPGNVSPFLFIVGVFSTYFVISGYRALSYKRLKDPDKLRKDKMLAFTMLLTGISMLGYAVYLFVSGNQAGWIMIAFGLVALNTARIDFKALKDIKTLRKKWLAMHINKIMGGYIAAFTAFIVVNNVMHPLLNWLLPGAIGAVYITYWLRKIKPKEKATA